MISRAREDIHVTFAVNLQCCNAKCNVHGNAAVDGWPLVSSCHSLNLTVVMTLWLFVIPVIMIVMPMMLMVLKMLMLDRGDADTDLVMMLC